MEANNKEQVEALRNHLKQLSNFSSWHLIRDELQTIVIDIENELFEPDIKSNDKVFTLHDIKRAERKILKLLISLPSNLFDELDGFKEFRDNEEEEQ